MQNIIVDYVMVINFKATLLELVWKASQERRDSVDDCGSCLEVFSITSDAQNNFKVGNFSFLL